MRNLLTIYAKHASRLHPAKTPWRTVSPGISAGSQVASSQPSQYTRNVFSTSRRRRSSGAAVEAPEASQGERSMGRTSATLPHRYASMCIPFKRLEHV